jgi:hypothetical protein
MNLNTISLPTKARPINTSPSPTCDPNQYWQQKKKKKEVMVVVSNGHLLNLTIVNYPPTETMLELATMRKKNNGNNHLPNSRLITR